MLVLGEEDLVLRKRCGLTILQVSMALQPQDRSWRPPQVLWYLAIVLIMIHNTPQKPLLITHLSPEISSANYLPHKSSYLLTNNTILSLSSLLSSGGFSIDNLFGLSGKALIFGIWITLPGIVWQFYNVLTCFWDYYYFVFLETELCVGGRNLRNLEDWIVEDEDSVWCVREGAGDGDLLRRRGGSVRQMRRWSTRSE